jgi:hypothetical protein
LISYVPLKIHETEDANGVGHVEIFGHDQVPDFDWEVWITGILDDPKLSQDAKSYALVLLTKVAESEVQRLMDTAR